MIYVNARAIIERFVDNTTEIIIQIRNKPGDSGKIELPGGQVKIFESLIDALKREVFEETGLEVTEIEGLSSRIDTSNIQGVFTMECMRPFAVYQTLKGPVDSMGVYFKCKAIGQLKEEGDDTLNVKWIDIHELSSLVYNNHQLFSEIDLAGILFYLNEKNIIDLDFLAKKDDT